MERESQYGMEFWLLLALAFFLPLYEAPKNILWVAYVGMWLLNRWRGGKWGGPWEGWDTLIALWITSGYVVAAFSATHDSEWGGATDILRYASILWCIRRSGYSSRQIGLLGGMLLVGCVTALAWGFWRYYVTHQRSYVELHSVGHVNHSAPYLAMCVSLAMAWLFSTWRRWRAGRRLQMMFVFSFILAGLVIGSSRGAIGAMVLAAVVLAALWRRRSPFPLRLVAIALIAGIPAMIASNIGVVEKQRSGIQAGDHLSQRGTIWKRAVVAWQANPWFGVGIDNFGMITDDMLKREVESRGKVYVPEDYRGPNHAHSLYLNTLAERGTVGFSVFAAVMLIWAVSLWKERPQPADVDMEWTFWGASMSSWVIIMGAGIFNTTLHHEIAILAMLLLGGWMTVRKTTQPISIRRPADS